HFDATIVPIHCDGWRISLKAARTSTPSAPPSIALVGPKRHRILDCLSPSAPLQASLNAGMSVIVFAIPRGAGAVECGVAMKPRQTTTTKSRGRKETTPVRRRGPSTPDLQERLDARTRELSASRKALAQSLEQQAAMAEVLNILSRSPTHLRPVFDAILAHAT